MYTIQRVYNLKWDDEGHNTFTCMVKFAEFDEDLPFTANPADKYTHTQTIWKNGIAGEFGKIEEYTETNI